MSTKVEYIEKRLKPVFGETAIEVSYAVTTEKNNFLNRYTVTARLRGLNTGEPYLEWNSAEVVAYDNNEETKTEEAIQDGMMDYFNV